MAVCTTWNILFITYLSASSLISTCTTESAEESSKRFLFSRSQEPIICGEISTISALALHQMNYGDNVTCDKTDLIGILYDLCKVPNGKPIQKGQKVVDACAKGSIKPYTAIGNYDFFTPTKLYDKGLIGIFLNCTANEIKLATQECHGKFQVIHLPIHSTTYDDFTRVGEQYHVLLT